MSTRPGLRSFTRPNLFPVHLTYDAYRDSEKVSPLARQLDVVDRGDEA